MVNTREKDLSVETLRGVAILMVVTGHVIGDGPQYAMRVSNDSFLRHFYYSFVFLRIPLFTVISGWVYALLPATIVNLKSFAIKKARRLLLPLIFVGGAYYLVQYVVPGTTNKNDLSGIWRLFVFPFTLYWYLPSLFFVFIIVSLLDANRKMQSIRYWLLYLFFTVALLVAKTYLVEDDDPNYLSYKGVIYLLPFFLVGVGVQRFARLFSNTYLLIALSSCLVVGLIIQQLAWYDVIQYSLNKGTGIGLLIGLTGTVLLLKLRWKVKWLIWLGSFAYSIYLFHAFGTAGARIWLKSYGVQSTAIIFFASLLTGILLPIVAEKFLDRFRLTRLLFLGRGFAANSKDEQV